MVETGNTTAEVATSSGTVEDSNENEVNADGANLGAEFIEERIAESEVIEDLENEEVYLDPSMESLE